MKKPANGLVKVQNVPRDALFSYEGERFRKHYSDNIFTFGFCFSGTGFYVIFFNDTLVNLIESEVL